MKACCVLSLLVSLCLFLLTPLSCAGDVNTGNIDPAQVQQLQEQLLSNPDILALVSALQDDPEIQVMLSDPTLMAAIQRGDTAMLAADPRFMKLFDNPKVQAIIKQLR